MARRHSQVDEAEINLTPMLDVVFIMLIFFIVTTSFVKEAGIDVSRPQAATAEQKPKANIMIAITESGQIYMQKREIDLRAVRANVERARAENPEGSVVIIADKGSKTGILVEVMDQVKLAGVDEISVAAQKPPQ
ncbi:MAG: biopolymer transporter ExbD [Lysobacterales bacterium]|jgi:biopolymer transport protein ExbD|nr:MAG: biopolymer transporter ExbD [Xanthomonadales bacterium]